VSEAHGDPSAHREVVPVHRSAAQERRQDVPFERAGREEELAVVREAGDVSPSPLDNRPTRG
jgi:hypothetical protein